MSKDLTKKLNGSIEDKIDLLVSSVQSMDSRLERVDNRLENVESHLKSLDARLTSLETKVDERLKDTRPMWEAVQAQLVEIKESQDQLRDEMEKGFRRLDRGFDHLAGDVMRLHGDQRGLEERIDKLEGHFNQ